MAEVLSNCTSLGPDAGECFQVRVRVDPPMHVVLMTGELDVASCAGAVQACTLPDQVHVVFDMGYLTFMDCAGYAALMEARAILERRGGSLSLTGQVGEPLRLLSMIGQGGHDPAWFPLESSQLAYLVMAESL